MEKPIKSLDKKTKEYLVEAGLERPSLGFAHNVMSQIDTLEPSGVAYQPLISGRGWLAVLLVVFGSVALLCFFPIDTWKQTDLRAFFRMRYDTTWSMNWQPSNTLLYGIVFLGLFLVQIPFLKKVMEKNIG